MVDPLEQTYAAPGTVFSIGGLKQARQQARAIAPQTHPPIPTEAIATLSAAIEEFTDTNRTLASELVKLRLALGESSAAVPEGQHLHPDRTGLTPNNSNGAVLLPTSG